MNRRKFLKSSGLGVAGLSLISADNPFQSNRVFYRPSGLKSVMLKDNGKALVNPDMGWTLQYYSNSLNVYGSKLEPSDTIDDFPGLSTIYFRVPWSFIEMEEGKCNWEVFDTPSQRWIDKGKRVAFRITAYESSGMQYATPEWVRKAGAKGTDVQWPGEQLGAWQPDFGDPVFLQKLENFLAAMAERYEGNPHVDFMDLGSMGAWGEGHTAGNSVYCSLFEGQMKHIDLHCKYFKKTLLAINDDYGGSCDNEQQHSPIIDYALSRGLTLRDDSIMVIPPPESWYSAGMAQLFWPTRPVIIETEHYGASKARNAFSKELLLKAVEDYHGSYLSIHYWPYEFLNEMKEGIDNVNKRLGYRIQLREASWPESVKLGETFNITSTLANAGVAPCYPGGYPCFTLKDDKRGIVSVLVDQNVNVKDLKVGKPGEAPVEKKNSTFSVSPTLYKGVIDSWYSTYRSAKPGDYDIYFSIGLLDGTPQLELPYEGNDGHKRYKLGKIQVTDRET